MTFRVTVRVPTYPLKTTSALDDIYLVENVSVDVKVHRHSDTLANLLQHYWYMYCYLSFIPVLDGVLLCILYIIST
jgi:hypothetical protein